jgi:Tol biopolymer transport system component
MTAKLVMIVMLFTLLAGCAGPTPAVQPPDQPPSLPGPTPAPTLPEPPPPGQTPEPTTPQAYPGPGDGPGQPLTPSELVAYVGWDENIWLVDPQTMENRQVTLDASPFQPGVVGPTLRYDMPRWSEDGRFLAFIQEQGEPHAQGFNYTFSLVVYEPASGSLRAVLKDRQVAGFDWRPGTNQIAFGVPAPFEYWVGRGQPASEYARGIWSVDVLSLAIGELVPPLEGVHLAVPRFSPDGRFLAFEEITLMEGRGSFAYFDFETGEYLRWDRSIGSYDWSPDGSRLAYDQMVYIPLGDERIWISDRSGSSETPFTTTDVPGYAGFPRFSPDGSHIAFIRGVGPMEDTRYTLHVQSLAGGEERNLGEFEQPMRYEWTADGSRLIFSSGPYGERDILELSLADGSVRVLAEGEWPAVQGR